MRRRIRRRAYGIRETAGTLAISGVGAVALVVAAVLPSIAEAADGDVDVADLAGLGDQPPESPIRFIADRATFEGVDLIRGRTPLRLANGELSPEDTIYLKMNRLTADNLRVESEVNGTTVTVRNDNRGDPALAAVAGGADSEVEAWAVVNEMDVCVAPEALYAAANGLGRSAEARDLISSAYGRYANQPAGRGGRCIPLSDIVPALMFLTQSGASLPEKIKTENLDLTVFHMTVDQAPGLSSLTAPTAVIGLG